MLNKIAFSMALEDWQATDDPLIFKKELIYVDTFTKDSGDEKYSLSVNDALIDHWVNTFAQYTKNGNKVPLPVNHTHDPEKNRGEVIGMESGVNKKGKKALYGITKFRDAESAKLAMTSNVSIYVEPTYKDGKGVVYDKPITHVALTDYPVVPGLEPFEAIVMSNDPPEVKRKKMTLQELAAKFGLDPATPPEQVFEAISLAFDELKGQPQQGQPPAPGAPPAPGGAPKPPAPGQQPPPKRFEQEAADDEVAVGLSNNPIIVDQTRENREMKIDKLVESGRITPAVAKDLKKQYCCDDSIKLSLRGGADSFNAVYSTLMKNDPVIKTGSRTGVQGIPANAVALSRAISPESNPLIASAKARAEAAHN